MKASMCTMRNTLYGITADYALQKEKIVFLKTATETIQTEPEREK